MQARLRVSHVVPIVYRACWSQGCYFCCDSSYGCRTVRARCGLSVPAEILTLKVMVLLTITLTTLWVRSVLWPFYHMMLTGSGLSSGHWVH